MSAIPAEAPLSLPEKAGLAFIVGAFALISCVAALVGIIPGFKDRSSEHSPLYAEWQVNSDS